MPADALLRAMNAGHRALLVLSRGRMGRIAAGMPVLELTTTGRRTGRRHTVLLTAPLHDDAGYVVVASRGGDDRPPAWLVNLTADPRVHVRPPGDPGRPMHARVADPTERAELWPRIIAGHPLYARYQERTSREIAVVVLGPVLGHGVADGPDSSP